MVPNIISTKDLSYLEDIYEWNFNSAKALREKTEKLVDDEIKKMFIEANKTHIHICNLILKILGGKHE